MTYGLEETLRVYAIVVGQDKKAAGSSSPLTVKTSTSVATTGPVDGTATALEAAASEQPSLQTIEDISSGYR